MKSGLDPKSAQPKLQESSVDEGSSKILSKRSCTGNESHPSQHKPLLGKCFYLDLQFSKKSAALEKDIKKLGGTIEKFFSKEIRYLVSDKQEARYVQHLGRNSSVPSPSSASSLSSPHPSNSRSPKSPAQHIATSRGKSLVEKVVKEQERMQINQILSSALSWGVKILYIDDIVSYIEKKKRDFITSNKTAATAKKDAKTGLTEKPSFQKSSLGRIKRPFIKIEDSSRHYKPICLSMPYLPEFNFTTEPPCTPFLPEDSVKISHGKKLQEHETKNQERRDKPSKVRGKALEAREKKHGGYCECCVVRYENLHMHLSSQQHKAFLKTDVYSVVDRLISGLEFNFADVQTQAKKRKFSISSSVVHVSLKTPEGEKEVGNEDMDTCSIWGLATEHNTSHSLQHTAPQHQPKKGSKDRDYSGCSPRPPASPHEPTGHPYDVAEGDICEKTLVSAFRQLSDTNVTDTNLSYDNSHVAEKGTDKKCHLLRNFPEDLVGSSAAQRAKVAYSHLGVTEFHGDRVPVPTMERDQNRMVQGGTGENSSSSAGEMQSSPRRRFMKVRDFKRQQKVSKRPPEGSVEEEDPVKCPLQILWQLLESSEDTDFEFRGFD